MNSVFNLASYNFNQLTDDELIAWIRSEGLSNMPPIIRTLVDRLDATQPIIDACEEQEEQLVSREERLDANLEDFANNFQEALNELDGDLEDIAEKVSSAVDGLELSELGVLRNGEVICKEALKDPTKKDLVVIPRGSLEAIKAVLNGISSSLIHLEAGDKFPEPPTV
ncbi:hypothetical protein [Parasutterella excrementihominis]|uniref:hypothetical protein n=1 Tax=Parasutterella excrementihominis TaxID=487175 RepID=UPI003AEF3AE8